MGKTLTNDFSWSKSRHEKFLECRRAYYFHYYQSWGGWDARAPETTRQLYVLKRLANRYTWSGSAVHEAIRGALTSIRDGRPFEPARDLERTHRVMQEDFRGSRQKRYWKDKIRKDFNGLIEHEYDADVPAEVWRRNWENVKQALEWFSTSRWPTLAKGLDGKAWLEVDTTDFDLSVFYLEGVKVFAVPDFAFLERADVAHIVDWKTGRAREGYDDQVLGYALYLHHRYRLPLEKMKATLVYLNEGTEKTVAIEPEALEAFRRKFSESVGAMRAVLRDPQRNVPHAEDLFPRTDSLEACARCPFRRPCGRLAEVVAAQGRPAATDCGDPGGSPG